MHDGAGPFIACLVQIVDLIKKSSTGGLARWRDGVLMVTEASKHWNSRDSSMQLAASQNSATHYTLRHRLHTNPSPQIMMYDHRFGIAAVAVLASPLAIISVLIVLVGQYSIVLPLHAQPHSHVV